MPCLLSRSLGNYSTNYNHAGLEVNLIGSTQGTKAELKDVMYWIGKDRIRPLIDVILQLGRIIEGYEKMTSGDHFGKIPVTPQAL